MRITFTACLLLAVGLTQPVHMSFSALPEDFEGSAFDLDTSGSGSGDWSEQGEITNEVEHPNSKDSMFDSTHWPTKDTGSGYIIMANSKSFWENEQIFAGVIAGGITGVAISAMLTAILIYKWHNKDFGGYIQGQPTHRDQVV